MFTAVFGCAKIGENFGERKEYKNVRHVLINERGTWEIYFSEGNLHRVTLDAMDYELIQVYAEISK